MKKIDTVFDQLTRHWTLKQRFMIPMIITVVIAMAFVSIFIYISETIQIAKDIEYKRASSAKQIALNFVDPLWNYNQSGITSTADAILLDREIGFLQVYDAYGQVYYKKHLPDVSYNSQYLFMAKEPITKNGEVIGSIIVGVSSYYRQQTLNTTLFILIVNSITIIAAFSILVPIISRFISKPIVELEQGTEQFATGSLRYHIPVYSNDAIGRLTHKFNSMVENINALMDEREQNALELQRLNVTLASQNKALTLEINERIAAQQALALSEEKFSKAFHYSAEVVGLLRTSDTHIIEINHTFYETFGYTPNQVLDHTTEEIGLWEIPEHFKNLMTLFNQNNSIRSFEARWVTAKNDIRIGLLSMESFEIQDVSHMLLVWNDITERKKAEEYLENARSVLEETVAERTSELQASNQHLSAINEELLSTLEELQLTQNELIQSKKMAALGSLVAGVAHEINTPVGISVTGITYLEKELSRIKEKLEQAQITKKDMTLFLHEAFSLTQTIYRNLGRADNLIKSFKMVAADQTTEERRLFNLKEYLSELLISLSPLLKDSEHKVAVNCPENLVLNSYPGVFAQIITNFVSNSLKHGFLTAVPGLITINVSLISDDQVEIRYADNGAGMDHKSLERVFDPFYTTRRGSSGSTGLGMNLVYNLVKQKLCGNIKCESTPGEGATFIIDFKKEP